MELRQIRHFVTVAEEMHFGRAAERLAISQSALSSSIQRLEEDCGIRLFQRDSRSVRITLAGQLMLDFAVQMLHHEERTSGFLRALSAGRVGRLEIGFNATVLHQGMADVLGQSRSRFPDIEIFMSEMVSERQIELLHAGRLDAGLVSLPLPPEGLEFIELREHAFLVCLPSAHPLAGRASIAIAELRDEFFVMHARAQSSGIHDQLVGFCAAAGFYPRIGCESSHVLSSVFLVARGLGVALVPDSLAVLGVGGVAFVPLALTLPRRSGYFTWNPGREAPGLEALIGQVRATFRASAAG